MFVALEFNLVLHEPFWLSLATIMAGEFIAVGIIGTPIFMLLSKRKEFLKMVGAEDRYFAIKEEIIRAKKYRKVLGKFDIFWI